VVPERRCAGDEWMRQAETEIRRGSIHRDSRTNTTHTPCRRSVRNWTSRVPCLSERPCGPGHTNERKVRVTTGVWRLPLQDPHSRPGDVCDLPHRTAGDRSAQSAGSTPQPQPSEASPDALHWSRHCEPTRHPRESPMPMSMKTWTKGHRLHVMSTARPWTIPPSSGRMRTLSVLRRRSLFQAA
jgi:hypothetical protein